MKRAYSYVIVGQRYDGLQCIYGLAMGHNKDEIIGFATSKFRTKYPDYFINMVDAILVTNIAAGGSIENGELIWK